MNKIDRYTNRFWDLWEIKSIFVTALVALLPLALYLLGFLGLIRENTGSLITYASALVTINGVFLTLIVTLKQSQIFERLRSFFPILYSYLYDGLKGQIKSCIIFILINLVIALVGPVSNKVISSIGMYIWSYFIINISFGAFYTLRIITRLASSKIEKRSVLK